jgi:multiple sugar transport system permease protein
VRLDMIHRVARTTRRRFGLSDLAFRGVVFVAVVGGALFTAVPFLYMLTTSLKSPPEMSRTPISFLPDDPTNLSSFVVLFERGPWLLFLLNSTIVTTVGVISSLTFSTLAGYAFAKLKFPGRNFYFMLILAVLMVPFEATVVPLFKMINAIGLANTYVGLMAPHLLSMVGVFLMRQFIEDIPDDYLDAARIDGASELSLVWRVVVPLSIPALITLAIVKFLWIWNDFLWPLVAVRSEAITTLTLGLANLKSEEHLDLTLIAAGAVFSLLPVVVLFVLLQRYVVQGISRTGVAGF